MDSVFGFVGKDYAIVAADASQIRSVICFQEGRVEDVGCGVEQGPGGVRAAGLTGSRFCEFIQKNLKLDGLRTGLKQSVHATANYVSGELATALRKGPFQVNCLLGGYDGAVIDGEEDMKTAGTSEEGPSLYWMDYMGTLQKTTFGAHGYCGVFVYSLFDAHWNPGMSREEGIELARRCINEVNLRLVIAQPKFIVKLITKDGISEISV